jgi:imidazolonepropionase
MPDVYTLLRNNGIIALTTDHSPALMNLDMIETMNLASIYFSLPPANIIAATTVNAAYSLRTEKIGSIKEGFQADLVILNVKSYRYIGYLRKRDLIKYVIKRGRILYRSSNQKL